MKQLETLSIVAPGFFGLNTQESGVTLSPNFAQLTDNVVIDKYGRLGARKGWVMQTTDGATALAGDHIRFMLEHVSADDSLTILSAGNHKVFSGGVGGSLTDITPAGYTISDNDWSGATLLDTSILTQSGHEPLVYNSVATPKLQTMSDYTGLAQNYGTVFPHGVISAWGRYWAFTKDTVYWSTDIADANFPTFSGGTSGTLNIAAVLPDNTDDIEAVAAHNNFLIIFCKHNIVIYSGAENPIGVNFALHDVINGVGCIAHKSVQNTGNDLIFLADTGIRSLGRVIQEKSLPMRDLTKNVRDDFLKDVSAEIANYGSLDHVGSVYSEVNAFYLISFPSTSTIYVLDMRSALEDGSARITVWYEYLAYSFLRLRNRDIYVGKQNGIGKYSGYTDNGDTYRLRYFSHYVDFGSPTVNKILKQIGVTVLGGSNQQFTIKVGTDYSAAYRSYPFIVQVGNVFEYGVGEYVGYNEFKGIVPSFASLPVSPVIGDAYMIGGYLEDLVPDPDLKKVFQWDGSTWQDVTATWKTTFTVSSSIEFSKGVVLDKIKSSVGGSGTALQIGFEADVNGSELSVQKIDAFIKTGRTS